MIRPGLAKGMLSGLALTAVALAVFLCALIGLSRAAHADTGQRATCAAHVNPATDARHGTVIASDCGAQVTVQLWEATTASGNPLTAQILDYTAYDGPLTGPLTIDLSTRPVDLGCFWQLDVAYGHAKTSLAVPYGRDLIASYHGGTVDCTTVTPSPTPTAVVTVSPIPAPTTTEPTPAATTAPPTTTAPAPTTAAPVAPVATPAPTTPVLLPPVTVTKPPAPHKTKTPRHHPKPKAPKPTPAPSVSGNPGGGFGCVGTNCDTPTPVATTPAPTLPYTGLPVLPIVLIASGGILFGAGSLVLARKLR